MKNLLYSSIVVGEKHTTTAKMEAEHQQGRKPTLCRLYGILIISTFILCNSSVIAQQQYNLVNNYSFEEHLICPGIGADFSPPGWVIPSNYNEGAYVHQCATHYFYGVPVNYPGAKSYQYAQSGDAYMIAWLSKGINANKRSYLQNKLKDSLSKDHYYYVEFYTNLTNSSKYACNNVSVSITKNKIWTDTLVDAYGIINSNAQVYNYGNPIIDDTLNWVKVSSVLKAQGGEQYLTFGNFKKDSQTLFKNVQTVGLNFADYYLDDVSVIPLDSFCLKANAGRDTTIAVGDSVFIGCYTNGLDSVKWFNGSGQLIDTLQPGFWVKPTSAGTYMYVLQQTVNGCYSSDTVYINAVLPLNFINYNVISTKEKSVENVWATANEINVSHYNIERSTNAKDFTVIGKVKANNKTSNEYSFEDKSMVNSQWSIVYYRVVGVDNDGRKTYSPVKSVQLKVNSLSGVSVYPNPAKDVVNISCVAMKEVNIINELGQIVYKQIATGTNLRNDAVLINTKNFNKGLYIVEVILTNGTTKNEKLIVQ